MKLSYLQIEKIPGPGVEDLRVEIVERKGLGHPDYIADAACEAVSRALSLYYLENFGTILHHNVDKGLLVGGRAAPKFAKDDKGGGRVLEPIEIIVAGRATTEVVLPDLPRPRHVPVHHIAKKAVWEWIDRNLRHIDVDEHIRITTMIRPGSADLRGLFEVGVGRRGERPPAPLANDTSFGVSFRPLSRLETLVLEVERFLNSPDLKQRMPWVGEDVKVMGLRKGDEVSLTVAAAFVSRYVYDESDYLRKKQELLQVIEDHANRALDQLAQRRSVDTSLKISVSVNTADRPENNIFYITVTGTSAEGGDDGNTGRGNRVHGLITPCRYMSLEATAGKNPVNHVGKIYNVLADKIAQEIVDKVSGIREVYVKALSQIGKPINEPQMIHVLLVPEAGFSISAARSDIEDVVARNVERVTDLTTAIIKGEVSLF